MDGSLVHPYDFHTLRYIFAGAEKLHEETRMLWFERFGVRVLQGYGVTETAPVLSVNTPMENRSGTVGRALPGVEVRLESESEIRAGKRLYVRGENVMTGYMREDAPERIDPPPDGWHDTGDIVTVDDDGFITIVDRFGRFAKIGGEMVSLGAVEVVVGELWRDVPHTVVAVPDADRGESLVLLTLQPDHLINRQPLLPGKGSRALGLPSLLDRRQSSFAVQATSFFLFAPVY